MWAQASNAGAPQRSSLFRTTLRGSAPHRGLTPRSTRGPTAWHQAREAVWCIIGFAGLAPIRRSRVTSTVRPRKPRVAGLRAWARFCAFPLASSRLGVSYLSSMNPTARPRLLLFVPRASPLISPRHSRRALPSGTGASLRVAILARQRQGSARECSWCMRLEAPRVRSSLRGACCRQLRARTQCLGSRNVTRTGAAPRPNPSVNARPNGLAPGPRSRVVHLRPRGPGTNPSVPRYLER